MDEVALAGLLQTTKFVQTLHPHMPKAQFEIFALLAWAYICSGLPIVVGTGTVFWHRLEIARRDTAHRREVSFLDNASLGFPSSCCHALPN
jgi:hypothetical protein